MRCEHDALHVHPSSLVQGNGRNGFEGGSRLYVNCSQLARAEESKLIHLNLLVSNGSTTVSLATL